jgi:hypothetical protein
MNADGLWTQFIANEFSPNVAWFFTINFAIFIFIILEILILHQ